MRNRITITNKGQITIPVAYGRKLGVDGDVLDVRFDEAKGELVIAKLLDIDELSQRLSSYIKPHGKPLTDVDAHYQGNRET